MTPGIHGLLLKMLKNWPLCALREDELRFLHLSLTKLLTLSVNFYLWREAVINTGNRTNRVLATAVYGTDLAWVLKHFSDLEPSIAAQIENDANAAKRESGCPEDHP